MPIACWIRLHTKPPVHSPLPLSAMAHCLRRPPWAVPKAKTISLGTKDCNPAEHRNPRANLVKWFVTSPGSDESMDPNHNPTTQDQDDHEFVAPNAPPKVVCSWISWFPNASQPPWRHEPLVLGCRAKTEECVAGCTLEWHTYFAMHLGSKHRQ